MARQKMSPCLSFKTWSMFRKSRSLIFPFTRKLTDKLSTWVGHVWQKIRWLLNPLVPKCQRSLEMADLPEVSPRGILPHPALIANNMQCSNWTLLDTPLGAFQDQFHNFLSIGWDRTSAYIRRLWLPLSVHFDLTHPPTRPLHVPYSFRQVRGFFNVPCLTLKMQETGPTVFRPYPRRIGCLTICRCNYKGSTFSSVILRPWVLVRSGARTLDLPADWRPTNWANQAGPSLVIPRGILPHSWLPTLTQDSWSTGGEPSKDPPHVWLPTPTLFWRFVSRSRG